MHVENTLHNLCCPLYFVDSSPHSHFPFQGRFQTWGVRGVLPTLAGKWGGVGGFFLGKIRHNEQKLSISLTFFPFIFDQMFTSSSF